MHYFGALDVVFVISVSVSLWYGVSVGKDLPKNVSDLITTIVAAKLTAFSANKTQREDLDRQQKEIDDELSKPTTNSDR